MNTKSTNMKNGDRGKILAFSFLRKKKWLSAIMALIFLFNTCAPAWAREGNYGDKTSWDMFGSGALAGVVTIVSCIVAPVMSPAGSIASDITGLYMFYGHYSDSGEVLFTLGNVEFTKGQVYSMVAGIVASAAAGFIAGAITGGGNTAGSAGTAPAAAPPPPVPPAIQFVRDTFKSLVGSNIYIVYGAAGQFGYALLSLAGDLVIGSVKLIFSELIKQSLQKALHKNFPQLGDLADTIAEVVASIYTYALSLVITPLVRNILGLIPAMFGIQTALTNQGAYVTANNGNYADAVIVADVDLDGNGKISEDEKNLKLSSTQYLQYQKEGKVMSAEMLVYDKDGTTKPVKASEINKALAYANAKSFTVTIKEGKETKTIEVSLEEFNRLQLQGKLGTDVQATVNLSDGTQEQAKVSDINTALSYTVDTTYTVTVDSKTKTVSAQTYLQLVQEGKISANADMAVNFKSRFKSGEELKAIFNDTYVLLLMGQQQTAVVDSKGRPSSVKLNQLLNAVEGAKKNDDGTYSLKFGDTVIDVSAKEFGRLREIPGLLVQANTNLLGSPVYTDVFRATGGLLNDIRGNPIGGLGAGLKALEAAGIAPFVGAGVKIAVLFAVGLATPRSSDEKRRTFDKTATIALADFFGNLSAGVASNLTDNNPGKMEFGQYFAKEFPKQLALLASEVSWAGYCWQTNTDPDVMAEFRHMAASSIIGGLVDLIRMDPGKTEKQMQLVKYEEGNFGYVDISNITTVTDENNQKTTMVDGRQVEMISERDKQFLTDADGNVLIKDSNGKYGLVSLKDITYDKTTETYKNGAAVVKIIKQGQMSGNQVLIRTKEDELQMWDNPASLPKDATLVSLNRPKEDNVGGQKILAYNIRSPETGAVLKNQVFIQGRDGSYRFVDANSLTLDKDGKTYRSGEEIVTIRDIREGEVVLAGKNGDYLIYSPNDAKNPVLYSEGKYYIQLDTSEGQRQIDLTPQVAALSLDKNNASRITFGGTPTYSYKIAVDVSGGLNDLYYQSRKNLTFGRFAVAIVEDFGNYLIQSAARSALYISPQFSPGTGLNGFMEQQQAQDAMIAHIAGIMQGASPIQLVAGRFAANLNYFANTNLAESFGAVFSNPFLNQEYRSYATFIPAAEKQAYLNDLRDKEMKKKAGLLAKMKLLSKYSYLFGDDGTIDKDKIESMRKSLQDYIANQDEQFNSNGTYDYVHYPAAVAEQMAALEELSEVERLNNSAEIQDIKVSILSNAARLGVTTGNVVFSGAKDANDKIFAMAGEVMERLGAEMKATAPARSEFGLNNLITGGIVDYTVNRSFETNAAMSDYLKTTLKEYIIANAKNLKLSDEKVKAYTEALDKANEKTTQLVSTYSSSIAGVYQGTETYGQTPLLSAGNITPYLTAALAEATSSNNPLIVEDDIIKEVPKAEEMTERLKQIKLKLEEKDLADDYRTKLDKEKTALENIQFVQETRKKSPELAGFTWLPGEANKENVIKALKELSQGRMVYSDYGLLQRTAVDSFGRPVETTYYAPEFIEGKQQSSKQDIITEHYFGPFGQAASITADYTQVKLPDMTANMRTELDKDTLSGFLDNLNTQFGADAVATLAKSLNFTASNKDEFIGALQEKIKQDPNFRSALKDAVTKLTNDTNEAKKQTYFNNLRGKINDAMAVGVREADIVSAVATKFGLIPASAGEGGTAQTFDTVDKLFEAMKGKDLSQLPIFDITVTTTTPGEDRVEINTRIVDGAFLITNPKITADAAQRLVEAAKAGQPLEKVIISSPDGNAQFGIRTVSRGDAEKEVNDYIGSLQDPKSFWNELNDIHDLFWQGDAKRQQQYVASQYDKDIAEKDTLIAKLNQNVQSSKDQVAKTQDELRPLRAQREQLLAAIGAQEKIIADSKRLGSGIADLFTGGRNKNKAAAAQVQLQQERTNLSNLDTRINSLEQTVGWSTKAQGQSEIVLAALTAQRNDLVAQRTAAVNSKAWQNSDVSPESLIPSPWGLTLLTMIASGKTFGGKPWGELSPQEKIGIYGNSVGISRLMEAGTYRNDGTTQDYSTLKMKPGAESAYTTKYHPITNPTADGVVPADTDDRKTFKNVYVPAVVTKSQTAPVTKQAEIKLEKPSPVSKIGMPSVVTTTQYQPVSVGPNYTYDLNIYSTDQGHGAYAGPTQRITFSDINSGPALQTNAQYSLRSNLLERQLGKLIDNYARGGFRDKAQREQIVSFLTDLGIAKPDEKLSGLEKAEFVTKAIEEITLRDAAIEQMKASGYSENEYAATQVIPSMIQSRGQALDDMAARSVRILTGEDKEIFTALNTRQGQLNAALSPDFSHLRQTQVYKYEKIDNEYLALPVWGVSSGFNLIKQADAEAGIGQELRFSKIFDYTYDSAAIRASVEQGRIESKNVGNDQLDKILAGILVYPLTNGARLAIDTDYNSNILGAFYNRSTTIIPPQNYKNLFPEGISYQTRGITDMIEERDLSDK